MPDPRPLLAPAFGDLLHRPAGNDAGDVLVDQALAVIGGDIVRFLDEQPVLALFAFAWPHAHQGPAALHSAAMQLEGELALLQGF